MRWQDEWIPGINGTGKSRSRNALTEKAEDG